MRKAAGTLSIHGHNLVDERWYPACSSGANLVTLECSSRRRVKCTSELLSQIVDDETRKAVQVKFRKNSDVGCIVFLKGNWLVSRMQCEDAFDISSITVSMIVYFLVCGHSYQLIKIVGIFLFLQAQTTWKLGTNIFTFEVVSKTFNNSCISRFRTVAIMLSEHVLSSHIPSIFKSEIVTVHD